MSQDSAALICPRCGSDAGMLVAQPWAVCLGCGAPFRVTFGVIGLTPILPGDERRLTIEAQGQLARLIRLRDRAMGP